MVKQRLTAIIGYAITPLPTQQRPFYENGGNQLKSYDPTDENRPALDWVVFTIIFVVLVSAIWYAGLSVYGPRLGHWVGASAFIAGLVHLYLFAKIVPGETIMKIWLGICVALNAGYIVHNGAAAMGIEAYNSAQVKKYEIAMGQAAQATSRRVAREVGLSAQTAAQVERAFGDGVAFIAAFLAFLELSSSIVIFAIASKRLAIVRRRYREDDAQEASTKPTMAMSPPLATAKNNSTTINGGGNFRQPPQS